MLGWKKQEFELEGREAAQQKHTDYLRKKEVSIIKTWEEPVLPVLSRIIFRGMWILMTAMLLVDINAFIRYGSYLGWTHLYGNLCTTGFWSWLFLSLFLLLSCGLTIGQITRKFWKQKKESGITERNEEDRQRNQRALKRLNQEYWKYIKIDLLVLGVWLLLYLISIIFT